MREHENRSRHDAPETLNLIELKKRTSIPDQNC